MGKQKDKFEKMTLREKKHYLRREIRNSVILIAFLAFVNLYTSPGYLWFLWPLAGIALGLGTKAAGVWGPFKDPEDAHPREPGLDLNREELELKDLRREKAYRDEDLV